jgi:hypothetical protein
MPIERRRRRSNNLNGRNRILIPNDDEVQFISASPAARHARETLTSDDDVQIIGVISRRVPAMENVIEIISPPAVVSQRRSRIQPASRILAEPIKTILLSPVAKPKTLPVPLPELQNAAQLKCTICLELASSETNLVATNCGHVILFFDIDVL